MAAGAKIGIKLISVVIGIPIGIVVRKAVDRAWLAARPDDPARKTSEAGVRWGDAMVWGALSAAGVVATDLLTRRGAEAAYSAITGNPPPPAKQSKAAKQLEAAENKVDARADAKTKAKAKAKAKA